MVSAEASVPQYVILAHDHPAPHWDFMLETERGLRTWRLNALPVTGGSVAAEEIDVHRRAYLDYEGPVSRERGTVARWDRGIFDGNADGPDQVDVRLRGETLEGTITLTCGTDRAWELSFRAS
jgi:hypothetical protein